GGMRRIGSMAFFEVDAALRPEGRSGELVRTLESHTAYYTRWAKTWEFQALLKSRPMTGDLALGEEYHTAVYPLVWTAAERDDFVSDVQAMRRRVEENVPATLRDRELKLGRGGLRDVEFAVQLLQMVHGRTDVELRVASTVDALRALRRGGYIAREDGADLVSAYEFLRLLEHRLQLQRYKRTHLLPPEEDAEGYRWLARAARLPEPSAPNSGPYAAGSGDCTRSSSTVRSSTRSPPMTPRRSRSGPRPWSVSSPHWASGRPATRWGICGRSPGRATVGGAS